MADFICDLHYTMHLTNKESCHITRSPKLLNKLKQQQNGGSIKAPASSLETEMNSQRTDESVLYSSGIKNCFIITSDCARDSLDQVTKQQRKRMYNKTWGISPNA
eukprot:158640_1